MVIKGITGTWVAKKAGCTKQYISAIIKRRRSNFLVEQIIAEAIGKPINEVFPEAATKEAA